MGFEFLSTQEDVLEEVIHEHMTKSSLHQAKLDAQRNGKDNETGLRRHEPYPIRGGIRKLRQLKTKGNKQNLLFVR
jgi:hypothetical protein